MAVAERVSRTQEQRREQTRAAILEAAVSCLVEHGYARTTTLEVQKRAGVSRGALLHHFPSKADLLTATIRHLTALRGREIADAAAGLPAGAARIDAVIDLLWDSFSGRLFFVAMELRNAARTEPDLREVVAEVELDLRRRILQQSGRLIGEVTGEDIASSPVIEDALDMTLQLMIGAAMSTILHRDDDRARALIARWKPLFQQLLADGQKTGQKTSQEAR